MESDTDSPIEALAAQAVQAEAVSSGLAEAAMADLMTSQEDASAALAEGFREFEEIEKE